jgi:hypothetical protein
MKICKICGKQLQEEALFCKHCGNDIRKQTENEQIKQIDTEQIKKKNKSQKIIIPIVIVVTIFLIGAILAKDSILYSYYKTKGDKANSISSSINYYTDAIKIKYTDDIVEKISNKMKEDENFEDTLMDLKGVVEERDLNIMYIQMYVKKAKENFNNQNYETTLKYLSKAQTYNYNIETFEYYSDLTKAINEEKEQKEPKEEVVKQDIHIYKNDVPIYTDSSYDYYIIPDSSTRYLSKEELYRYDKSTLALIRNEIFARYGYIFKKTEYNNYFNGMSWYYPNSSFKGTLNELNSVEQYNINLIKSLE